MQTIGHVKANQWLMRNKFIITGHQIDGAMGSSCGGPVRKLSDVCLHNNAIVARGLWLLILHCRTPELPQRHLYR